MSAHQAIVLGGGLNGLTAAAGLRKAGLSVLVLERRAEFGGTAAAVEFHPGFRVPGLLHGAAGSVPEWLARELSLAEFGLKLRAAPPLLAPQRDGPGLLLQRDPAQARDELAAHHPADAAAYAAWRDWLAKVQGVVRSLWSAAAPPLLPESIGGLWGLLGTGLALRRLGRADLMELARVGPMCAADWLNEHFRGQLLKAALAGPALSASFTGPWSPGSAAVLLLQECLAAGDETAGGPAALAAVLEALCRHLGVELRAGAEVAGLVARHGRVAGVRLAGGEELEAEAVLSTLDPRKTVLELAPPDLVPLALEEEARHYRGRGTTAKLHLAWRGNVEFACRPGLTVEAARTGEHLDDLERAFDAAKYRQCSDRPQLDLRVPSVAQPDLAPPGHHVVSIVAHFAPFHVEGGWSAARRERFYRTVIEELERCLPGAAQRVVAWQLLAPPDFDAEYGTVNGHLLHGELALDQLLGLRPFASCGRYATPVPGLFLGGSGSHPGGLVPCAAGRLAAAALARSLGARTG